MKKEMNGYVFRWKKGDRPWEEILADILRKDHGIDPCPQILRDAYGKPHFAEGGVHFNVSHSGEYLAIVVAKSPVGIDIQKLRSVREGMYRKVVQQKEQPLIGKDRERDFIRLWTLKESFVKAEGRGLRIPMASYHFEKEEGQYFVKYGGQKLPWTFNIEETLFADYVICVCGTEKKISWSVENAV